jgi:hypothetical protein
MRSSPPGCGVRPRPSMRCSRSCSSGAATPGASAASSTCAAWRTCCRTRRPSRRRWALGTLAAFAPTRRRPEGVGAPGGGGGRAALRGAPVTAMFLWVGLFAWSLGAPRHARALGVLALVAARELRARPRLAARADARALVRAAGARARGQRLDVRRAARPHRARAARPAVARQAPRPRPARSAGLVRGGARPAGRLRRRLRAVELRAGSSRCRPPAARRRWRTRS